MSEPFETMYAGDDGWSDWVHPLPGYRMKCCDCGLVHEMEFAIGATANTTTEFNDGEGKDGVVLFRARRALPPPADHSASVLSPVEGSEGKETRDEPLLPVLPEGEGE